MKRVDGVVLAAGPSRRFREASAGAGGSDLPPVKQLFKFEGESLVRRASRTALAAQLTHVVVVVGCEARTVGREVESLPVTIIENPEFDGGQSTSVRAALAHFDERVDAALFIPCDQPLLQSATLDRLVAEWRDGSKDIVVPTWDGEKRAPVLIGRPLFDALALITGDSGGRQLFATYPDSIAEVAVDNGRELDDLDTLEDYRTLRDRH
jgi:molybdenum cofactor cytidylyltransferase